LTFLSPVEGIQPTFVGNTGCQKLKSVLLFVCSKVMYMCFATL